MFFVAGLTGKVGGAASRQLLEEGRKRQSKYRVVRSRKRPVCL